MASSTADGASACWSKSWANRLVKFVDSPLVVRPELDHRVDPGVFGRYLLQGENKIQ